MQAASRGYFGFEQELQVLGELDSEHIAGVYTLHTADAERRNTAERILQAAEGSARHRMMQSVLELPVGTSERVRMVVGDGLAVERILWDTEDSCVVNIKWRATQPQHALPFVACRDDLRVTTALWQLVGQEVAVITKRNRGVLDRLETPLQKAQYVCLAWLASEPDSAHRLVRIDMREMRVVASAVQALLVSPPQALLPANPYPVKQGDVTDFMFVGPSAQGPLLRTTCGAVVDGHLVLPIGAKVSGSTVVAPQQPSQHLDTTHISTASAMISLLQGQGAHHAKLDRHHATGEIVGQTMFASCEAADNFFRRVTTLQGVNVQKSKVPFDDGTTRVPLKTALQQLRRVAPYFKERLAALSGGAGVYHGLALSLHSTIGQYEILITGGTPAQRQACSDDLSKLVDGVEIKPSYNDAECLVTDEGAAMRMRSKRVLEVEAELENNGKQCYVRTSGWGRDTTLNIVGREPDEVAQQLRHIIDDEGVEVMHRHLCRQQGTSQHCLQVAKQTCPKSSRQIKNTVDAVFVIGNSRSVQAALRSIRTKEDYVPCSLQMCGSEEPAVWCLQKCGHSMCKGCAVGLIKDAIKRHDFPLRCVHCRDTLRVCDANKLLEYAQQKPTDLCLILLDAFLKKHPDQARACSTTPDCPGIRPAGVASARCSECNEASQDDKSDEAPAGSRQCPNCRMPLEKLEGCNAMKCPCGAAFCWLCMELCGKDAHGHFGIVGTPCYGKVFEGLYEEA